MGGSIVMTMQVQRMKAHKNKWMPLGTILLDVPKVAQRLGMSCWYASACMVSYYFRAGPRLGLPAKWAANAGIGKPDIARLAKNEGLVSCTHRRGCKNAYDATNLYWLLKDFGPIWCAGTWYGPGHCIVLTGIAGETIYLNDPDGGVEKTNTVKWFNEKVLFGWDMHLMRKDPSRS